MRSLSSTRRAAPRRCRSRRPAGAPRSACRRRAATSRSARARRSSGGLSQGAPVCWTWWSSVGQPGQVEQPGAAEADQRVLPERVGGSPTRTSRARARRPARRRGRAPSCAAAMDRLAKIALDRSTRRKRIRLLISPSSRFARHRGRFEGDVDLAARVVAAFVSVGLLVEAEPYGEGFAGECSCYAQRVGSAGRLRLLQRRNSDPWRQGLRLERVAADASDVTQVEICRQPRGRAPVVGGFDIEARRQAGWRRELRWPERRQVASARKRLVPSGPAFARPPHLHVTHMTLDLRILEEAVEIDEP